MSLPMETYHIDITAFPIQPLPPPPKEPKPKCPFKFKWSWRTNMLALPKRVEPKFVKSEPIRLKPVEDILPGTLFRCDHLSRPNLRVLMLNRNDFRQAKLKRKLLKNINKRITLSWKSIYNYYKKILRDKRLRQMKSLRDVNKSKTKSKSEADLEKARLELFTKLATPKQIQRPPRQPKKWKPLDQMIESVNKLSMPKEYYLEPYKDVTKVASGALVYEATEAILKLNTVPERRKYIPPPVLPPEKKRIKLKDMDLNALISPRIQELAKPQIKQAYVDNDLNTTAGIISPNALKYKATPRMLELAKPRERE